MLRAIQICILPSLLRNTLDELYNKGLINSCYYEALEYSSKIDAVIELLINRKDNGRGKIVFCHFRSEIDIIYRRLIDNGFLKVIKYDGRNSGGANLEHISDPADVLIIQIQTGSEGLNLQKHFSEIYFVSPHWNPCVEDQAIARCHRIGQINNVDVFKFQMSNFLKNADDEVDPITLETYINIMQNDKRELSTMILNTANA
jgi:SNF2 family DNA or RNA helicase